jgi:hypothetical protein
MGARRFPPPGPARARGGLSPSARARPRRLSRTAGALFAASRARSRAAAIACNLTVS